MTIDLKKKRIRIHKVTISQLGNPPYIHLLVNPEKRSLVICPCLYRSKDTLTIRCSSLRNSEYYSTSLVRELSLLNPGMDDGSTYMIDGIKDTGTGNIIFDFRTVTNADSFPDRKRGQYYEH